MSCTWIFAFFLLVIITMCKGYIVGKTPFKNMTFKEITPADTSPVLSCQTTTCQSKSLISCIGESYNQSAFAIGYNRSHLLSCFPLDISSQVTVALFNGQLYRRHGKFSFDSTKFLSHEQKHYWHHLYAMFMHTYPPHSCPAKFGYVLLYFPFLFGWNCFPCKTNLWLTNKHTFLGKTSLQQ